MQTKQRVRAKKKAPLLLITRFVCPLSLWGRISIEHTPGFWNLQLTELGMGQCYWSGIILGVTVSILELVFLCMLSHFILVFVWIGPWDMEIQNGWILSSMFPVFLLPI